MSTSATNPDDAPTTPLASGASACSALRLNIGRCLRIAEISGLIVMLVALSPFVAFVAAIYACCCAASGIVRAFKPVADFLRQCYREAIND